MMVHLFFSGLTYKQVLEKGVYTFIHACFVHNELKQKPFCSGLGVLILSKSKFANVLSPGNLRNGAVCDFVILTIIVVVVVYCCRMLSHLLVDKVCQCYTKLKLFMDTLMPSAVTLVSVFHTCANLDLIQNK